MNTKTSFENMGRNERSKIFLCSGKDIIQDKLCSEQTVWTRVLSSVLLPAWLPSTTERNWRNITSCEYSINTGFTIPFRFLKWSPRTFSLHCPRMRYETTRTCTGSQNIWSQNNWRLQSRTEFWPGPVYINWLQAVQWMLDCYESYKNSYSCLQRSTTSTALSVRKFCRNLIRRSLKSCICVQLKRFNDGIPEY